MEIGGYTKMFSFRAWTDLGLKIGLIAFLLLMLEERDCWRG